MNAGITRGVIQGCFPGGRPKIIQPAPPPVARPIAPPATTPRPVAQPKIGPTPAPVDRVPTFPSRLAAVQMRPGPILPGRPATGAIQSATPLRPQMPQPILPQRATPTAVQPHAGNAFALPGNFTLKPRGTGQPLPEPIQKKMESFFNTSFADVRVHVGPEAASIGALAFTHGADLYFAPGQYNPQSSQGQQLLGHELTHVVQQRAGRVRNPLGAGVAVVQDPALEAEAERIGRAAAVQPSKPTMSHSGCGCSQKRPGNPCSCSTQAKKAGPTPPAAPVGAINLKTLQMLSCSHRRLRTLEDQKNRACAAGGACKSYMSCGLLDQLITSNEDCVDLREQIQDECYNDEVGSVAYNNHEEQIESRRLGLNKCIRRYNAKRC
jgi:hypothetical protein